MFLMWASLWWSDLFKFWEIGNFSYLWHVMWFLYVCRASCVYLSFPEFSWLGKVCQNRTFESLVVTWADFFALQMFFITDPTLSEHWWVRWYFSSSEKLMLLQTWFIGKEYDIYQLDGSRKSDCTVKIFAFMYPRSKDMMNDCHVYSYICISILWT